MALPQSQEEEGMPWEGAPALAHVVLELVFMEFSQFQTSLAFAGKCKREFLHPGRNCLVLSCVSLPWSRDQMVLER